MFHLVFMKIMPTWYRCFYLGGMWTRNSNRPSCREVKFSWKRKQLLEEKIEEEKMKLELHVVDVVDIIRSRWMQCAWRLERLENMSFIPRCHSYRGLVSLCRWINYYLGCDYDRICYCIEMFYIVSMYGLIRCSGELYVVQWELCIYFGFNVMMNFY